MNFDDAVLVLIHSSVCNTAMFNWWVVPLLRFVAQD